MRLGRLGLVVAALFAGCGGSPVMGSLPQGVTGPHAYTPTDATVLDTNVDTIDQYSSTVYVQAVVDSVMAGETVTATLMPNGASQVFTAPQNGDVGLLFDFSGPFNPGTYTVTVAHAGNTVGSVSWTIADPTGGTP